MTDLRIRVNTITEELLETKGTRDKQMERFRDLTYVYSKEFSEEQVPQAFWYEDKQISINGKVLTIDNTSYTPPTLSDFVSICTSKSVELFWDRDTYTEYIDNR